MKLESNKSIESAVFRLCLTPFVTQSNIIKRFAFYSTKKIKRPVGGVLIMNRLSNCSTRLLAKLSGENAPVILFFHDLNGYELELFQAGK